MKIDDYRNAVQGETERLCAIPGQTMRNWASGWKDVFRLLLEGRVEPDGAHIGRGIFEPCSLIIARWEFLGSLLTGHSKPRSKRDQALQYAERFLVPVNGRYGKTHPTVAPGWAVAQLLFQTIRNGSLHGFTPSGVYDDATDNCIGWGVGYRLADRSQHLHFDDIDNLLVDGELLLNELIQSMHDFADHLDANKPEADGKLPIDNFREGFRWRMFPSKVNEKGRTPDWSF
jgi:hypothetical protein